MATFNCYDILGIPLNSTPDDIKKSYRKLATQYHPDKVSALPPKLKEVAHEEMRRINTAKETLLDAEKRSKHDKELQTPKTTQCAPSKAPVTNNGGRAPYTFACPHCSSRVSAIPIDRPYILTCPSCRGQMTIPKAPDNNPVNKTPALDKLNVYKEALRRALVDGVITRDENHILDGLREALGITPMEHHNILFGLQNGRI